MTTRQLTPEEATFVAAVADRLSADMRKQLLSDLANAVARPVSPDGSIVRFEIAGYQRSQQSGQRPFAVEAKTSDRDGAELTLLLHGDENGRLYELEIIRWGEGEVMNPNWNSVEFY